jgi:nitroreductase
MLLSIIEKNRSFRKYFENEPVSHEILLGLINLGRLSASGRNLQPLKYKVISDPVVAQQVFPLLGWAGYLKDGAPKEGERPPAYIIILGDTSISTNFGVDHGIAAQSILLGAVEQGLGGCIIATIRRTEMARLLEIPPRYEILLALAIGKPKEQVFIEPVGGEGDIKYWRDEAGHHVPKRALAEVVL